MRILAVVITWNNADVVGDCLRAISAQTLPPDEVLVVDNDSTYGASDAVPDTGFTLVRNERNLGVDGAVETGLRYAREHGYDLMWIFNAYSRPLPEVLQACVDLHARERGTDKGPTGIFTETQTLDRPENLFQGRRGTPGGPRFPMVDPGGGYCKPNTVICTGSLVNLDTVGEVGFPNWGPASPQYEFGPDFGDNEFSWRIEQAGYRLLVGTTAFIDHRVDHGKQLRLFGRTLLVSYNQVAMRRYMCFRNALYFCLHVYGWVRAWRFLPWLGYQLGMTQLGIVVLEDDRLAMIRACLTSVSDGLRGRMRESF